MSLIHEASNPAISSLVDTRIMICDASAAVDDLVFQSAAIDNKAVVATSHNIPGPIIGIIQTKLTTTSCRISFRAQLTGLSGLTRGKEVLLSSIGGFTQIPSLAGPGTIQHLGFAFSATEIFFQPSFERIILDT